MHLCVCSQDVNLLRRPLAGRDASLRGSSLLALTMEEHQQSWLRLRESIGGPILNLVQPLARARPLAQ